MSARLRIAARRRRLGVVQGLLDGAGQRVDVAGRHAQAVDAVLDPAVELGRSLTTGKAPAAIASRVLSASESDDGTET